MLTLTNPGLRRSITFKQLKGLADIHSGREFNKQVDVVNSNLESIDFEPFSVNNLPNKGPTIHLQPIKLKGVYCVFNFSDKMPSILSESVFPGFQIHFLSPKHSFNYVHQFISEGLESRSPDPIHLETLNFEDGDFSKNLKVWVSSPWM